MSEPNSNQVLSRLSNEEFVNREAELSRICSLNNSDSSRLVLLIGPPRCGKTEILRQSYDRLFHERDNVIPFYYALRRSGIDLETFARDYFSKVLAQFIAFRRNEPKLIGAADKSLSDIVRAAAPEDYVWVRSVVDSFTRASEARDKSLMARCALLAPGAAGATAKLKPLVMIDNSHLLEGSEIRAEFLRALEARSAAEGARSIHVLTGLRRVIKDLAGADDELIGRIEMIHLDQMGEESVERLIRRRTERLGIATSDSTIELMIQQLNHDLFYTRAIVDAATVRGSLRTFMDFEKLYAGEILNGRIGQCFDAVLREVATELGSGRAALEALALVLEADLPVPVDAVSERMSEHCGDAEALLTRLHSREFLNVSCGFVSGPADPVLSDYLRARYREQILGASTQATGEDLLNEKLKQSYELMMSRYNRAIQAQLIELISGFDSQTLPGSLLDQDSFEKRYRGMSRVQIRRVLDDELDRVRLPQIVLVREAGSSEQPGLQWRIFEASGFDGAIYTDANAVLWLIALINSKEPLDLETLGRIDQRVEAALRGHAARQAPAPQVVRWYISKEGFSAVASERLAGMHAYRSTFSHLDLIQDHLTRLALEGEVRPASEFELVIPVEDEAELIAARTAEQIARAAGFDTESVNQIKTAIIEACINAAEHGDSPDKKIHQLFAIDEDRLIITVSNKGKTFGWANEPSAPSVVQPAKGTRGRGLQIIRALMDEVKFERTDDGARLVMIKYLKRPGNQ
ncbi:MAG TPA: ATP-binding protein [Blastocatellia bacterium]|nr:ATP-binding protein [Blastocatellia bacterium]